MQKLEFYKKFTLITLIAVYVLILLGATVRASGSGMGCPDWPTCFGRIIPPTSVSQLPENYRELYAPKLASGEILEQFNARKTWTEYLNRLFGIIVGLLSLTLLCLSFSFSKTHKKIFHLTAGIFILICIQGALGAIVVATNLLPGIITMHMLMALIILCLFIYLIFTINQIQQDSAHPTLVDYNNNDINLPQLKIIYRIVTIALGLIILQMLMGTQVREMIDFASKETAERTAWLGLLSDFFYIHRSFSWVIIITNSVLLWTIYRHIKQTLYFNLQIIATLIIILQVLSGSLLNHLDFPIIVQPFHLLAATIILGIQFFIFLNIRDNYKNRLLTRSFC